MGESRPSTTRNPAQCLGRLQEVGTIEDVAHTRTILTVVRAGEVFNRNDLDELLKAAAEEMANAAPTYQSQWKLPGR